ncbi:hypothetical protein MKW98_013891 [Papaver atlanticum]|uniref:Sucrose synthase EPBD domain-containing protein n=1 Tax=Papaver atlanticum TaxID=357466 RepID=A0AAD4XDP6_9MAGN|nr:hypothetical protein MKW98_013891 [Papaver atlanticum]
MFHDRDRMHPLLDMLKAHNYRQKTMMLNDRIQHLNVTSDSICSVDGAGGVGRMTKAKVSSINCFSQIQLDEFFSRTTARILAVDMPPFMQS